MRRMARNLLVVALLVGLMGCIVGPPTPRQTLRTSYDGFAAVVNVLCDYYEAGYLTDEEFVEIRGWAGVAKTALDTWNEALVAGQPYSTAIERFNAALGELIRIKIRTETRSMKEKANVRPDGDIVSG